jgi:polysaccharide export outer membrane protein
MIRDKSRWLLVVLMCLAFMAAACSSNKAVVSPEAAPASQGDEYRLGIGDVLRISVFAQEELSREVEVDSSGRITLPLVGDLLVIGRTLNDVEQMIFDALEPEYFVNPVVTAEIIAYRDFYIIGEVANPGHFPYVGGMTVITAVAMAGGFTYRAAEDEFTISRGGQEIRGGKRTAVLPGDVIEVEERYF